MKINDLSSKIAKYGPEISAAADRVIRSGWWVLGKEVSHFERAFAEYVGCTHCVGVANGTDALELSLRAVGVGTGTLVATVANAGMYELTPTVRTAKNRFYNLKNYTVFSTNAQHPFWPLQRPKNGWCSFCA